MPCGNHFSNCHYDSTIGKSPRICAGKPELAAARATGLTILLLKEVLGIKSVCGCGHTHHKQQGEKRRSKEPHDYLLCVVVQPLRLNAPIASVGNACRSMLNPSPSSWAKATMPAISLPYSIASTSTSTRTSFII
jgi:hypothetical protein